MTPTVERTTDPPRTDRTFSVLLVCRSYPPVLGGSEVEAQRVCAGLRARGHHVEVVCCGGPPMPPGRTWVDPYGTPVHMYGSGPGRWNDYLYALGAVTTIVRQRRQFDAVYFLMPGIHVAAAVPVAGLLGLPCVMKFAGSSEISKVVASTVGAVELASLRRWCQRIMVLNDGMVEEAVKAGFDRSRLLWMPNPVDTKQYAPVDSATRRRFRQEFGIPADGRVAIFVGRLAPEKELFSLLGGFAKAAAVDEHAHLVLVGDGPLSGELRRLTDDLGIAGSVTFAGAQPSDEVCRWLQASDVFTLVSRREGLPVSLIEAMSVGLPAVVSDLPATAQLISEGEHGFRVPVRDEAAIASALVRLFGDPRLRWEFGLAARPVALGRFSIDHVLAEYERLFAEVVPPARKEYEHS